MTACYVDLTAHLTAFLDGQVASGRHRDAGDVVREALRRYEADLRMEQEEIAAIRDVIRDGREAIARGNFTLVTGDEDRQALRGRLMRGGASAEHGQG